MNKQQRTEVHAIVTHAEESGDVLQHHLSAFLQNDLSALMVDYSDESILITPDRNYTGLEEISGYLADLMGHFPKNASEIEVTRVFIKDYLVYITWRGKSQTIEVSFATDTFIIKAGKIKVQTFAGLLKFIN